MAQEHPWLSEEEKADLVKCWAKVTLEASEVGAEVMYRFLTVYPDTQVHFTEFDQSQGSPDLLAHGERLINAIGDGIKSLDNLHEVMAELADLHTNKLQIKPEYFAALSSVLQVTLARRYPHTLSPELHKALVKYISRMAEILQSKPS